MSLLSCWLHDADNSFFLNLNSSVQLHELGHNPGLGHAREDGASYGDSLCYMGYGGGDVKMCYNGEKETISLNPL